MARFHNNSYTLWLQDFEDGIGNILGKSLLDLQPASEHLGDARQLRDPDDHIVRDVTDVHLASKGHEMMFTDGIHVNILDDDHLIVSLFEYCAIHLVQGISILGLGLGAKNPQYPWHSLGSHM